ncbi:MAG TPA: hypothetical protein VF270_00750 [Ignavibacteriaceae bacterium]
MLRKHDTDSKKNRLVLPLFIAKSNNNKLKLTIDREELPKFLNLSLKKCHQLTDGFYLPEIKIINKPRTKIDYKILAGEYKLLIENGTVLNQAALARRLNVSRAWVTKVLKLGN